MDTEVNAYSQPFKVVKFDPSRRLVLGWALVSNDVDGKPYVDADKSHIPQSVVLDSTIDFMLHSAKADAMHDEMAQGRVLMAFPFLDGFADDFVNEYIGMPPGTPIKAGKRGLGIGVQFTPAVFAKFLNGEYTGFSGGGDAMAVFMSEGTCPGCRAPAATCAHSGVTS